MRRGACSRSPRPPPGQDERHRLLDRASGDDRPGDREVDLERARRRRRRTTRRSRSSGSTRPAGSTTSMREIVQDMIAAPMPVVVYVSPDGARAASAGPSSPRRPTSRRWPRRPTSAPRSPISVTGEDIGATSGRKIKNDAAAYVRALAAEHGRNATLAEEMVTDAKQRDRRRGARRRADRPDRPRPGRRCSLSSTASGSRGPKAQTLAHRRASRSRATTCRCSTSCSRSSSTRTSPTC